MGVKFHRHIVRTCTIHIRARKSSEEIDLSTVTRTTYNQDTKMESSKFSKNMSASKHNVHLLLVASPAAQEYWNRRFGSGQIEAARSAAQKFIDQESTKIAEPLSRQAKVQEIETNEIPQQKFVTLLPNAYIPSFTGTYGTRSPYWLRRF